MHYRPIQADCAQFRHTRLLCQQKHLDEQIFQFWQECASKRGKHIVIGMQIASNETEWHRLIGGTLNFPLQNRQQGLAIISL